MNDDLDYERIARYLAGECSKEESEEMDSSINKDPDLKLFIRKIWETRERKPKPWDVELTWNRLSKKMDQSEDVRIPAGQETEKKRKTRTSKTAWFVRIAAVFMIIGFAGLFGVLYVTGPEAEEPAAVVREMTTKKGQRAEVRLNDGTRIRLNADSKIEYPREFEAGVRTIRLTGEAYFEVATDDRPFFVYANGAVVQILGTEFNVQAYEEDEEVRVAVARGKVSVGFSDNDDVESALLEGGDLAQLKHEGSLLSVTHGTDLGRHLEWLENRLTFDNASMEEVATKLERWYGVEIEFSDPGLAEMSISATFDDESIHEVLRILQLSLDLDYETEGQKIIFTEKL
ncbi:MAG: FecR domain-containing protein [Balneolaceae bacterium]